MKLGDGWWELSSELTGRAQQNAKRHACTWYHEALPHLTGLSKAKVKKRLRSTPFRNVRSTVVRLTRTPLIGGKGGYPFEDLPRTQPLLIGFDYTLKLFNNSHLTIKSLQPVFLTSKGPYPSKVHGVPYGEVHSVRAKTGYAIGGIVAEGGHRVNGFKVIFMRITSGELNSQDSYQSGWLGTRRDGKVTLLAGNGNPVVGIYGRQAADLDSIGLIQVVGESSGNLIDP